MYRSLLIICLLFVSIVPQAWGQGKQYPNPNRQTLWNNLTDGINTLGQSPSQAAITKRRLHNERSRARIRSNNLARQKGWGRGQN